MTSKGQMEGGDGRKQGQKSGRAWMNSAKNVALATVPLCLVATSASASAGIFYLPHQNGLLSSSTLTGFLFIESFTCHSCLNCDLP